MDEEEDAGMAGYSERAPLVSHLLGSTTRQSGGSAWSSQPVATWSRSLVARYATGKQVQIASSRNGEPCMHASPNWSRHGIRLHP